jgi:hypothetical protein
MLILLVESPMIDEWVLVMHFVVHVRKIRHAKAYYAASSMTS